MSILDELRADKSIATQARERGMCINCLRVDVGLLNNDLLCFGCFARPPMTESQFAKICSDMEFFSVWGWAVKHHERNPDRVPQTETEEYNAHLDKEIAYLSRLRAKNDDKPIKRELAKLHRFIAYHKYINSDTWKKKAAWIKERDGHCCVRCGNGPPLARLEAHHKTYARFRDEIPDDLITLCRSCHQIEHGKSNPEPVQ